MKNIYQIILFLTISSLLLPSCLTLRPDSRSVSSPDYNGRVAVSGAHFKKKLSPIGISISIAAPLVGAGAGYMLAPIKYQNGEKTQDLMPANVALGAIVGYATNALINRSFGLNQQVECNDPNKWLRKVDRKYLVLNPSSSSFIAMPKSIEPNFQVKKWADVKDFKGAFPNSIYCNNVARNAMKNLGRSDLPNILKEFPNADCAAELKQSYINRAENTSQAINAGYLYSEYASQAEQKAADLVSSMQDAIDFGRAYAKSKYLESVLAKVNQYADVYSNRSTLPSLIEVFANVEGVNITKKALVNGSGTLEEYLKLGREYKDIVDVSDNAAIYYVKTVADAQLFKTQYPNSSYYQKFEGGYYVGNSTKGVTIMNNGDTYLDKSLSSAKQAHSQVLADRKRKEEERLAEIRRKEEERLAAAAALAAAQKLEEQRRQEVERKREEERLALQKRRDEWPRCIFKMVSLKCIQQEGTLLPDKIYFIFINPIDGEKLNTRKEAVTFVTGQERFFEGHEMNMPDGGVFQLWDADRFDSDDFLGEFTLSCSKTGKNYMYFKEGYAYLTLGGDIKPGPKYEFVYIIE